MILKSKRRCNNKNISVSDPWVMERFILYNITSVMGNQNAAGIVARVKKDRIEPLPNKVCINDDDDELIFMCQWVKQFVIRNTHQGLRSSVLPLWQERTPEAAAAKN